MVLTYLGYMTYAVMREVFLSKINIRRDFMKRKNILYHSRSLVCYDSLDIAGLLYSDC